MSGKWFANRGQVVQTVAATLSACVALVALFFVLKSNNSLPKASVVLYVSAAIFLLLIGGVFGRRSALRIAAEGQNELRHKGSSAAGSDLIAPDRKKLVIRSAFYGTGPLDDRDVTDRLAMDPIDALVVPVDNNFLGCDPAPMKYKRLRVEYSYGNLSILRVSRGEGGRLVLPEDSEIARLTTELEKMKLESDKGEKQDRHYPRNVFTTQRVIAEPPSTSPTVSHKDKIRVILTNHLDREVQVWTPLWRSSDVHPQYPFGSLLRLEGPQGWKADDWKDEVACCMLPIGTTFSCWIGLLPPIGKSIERRVQTHAPVGTAIFPVKIDGKLYEVPIDL